MVGVAVVTPMTGITKRLKQTEIFMLCAISHGLSVPSTGDIKWTRNATLLMVPAAVGAASPPASSASAAA